MVLVLLTSPKALPTPSPCDPRFPKSRAEAAFGEMKDREWTEPADQVSSLHALALLSIVALAWSPGFQQAALTFWRSRESVPQSNAISATPHGHLHCFREPRMARLS